LKALDFGVTGGEKFAGLKIPTFEEILEKFASRCVMNIHVKLWDTECDERALDEMAALIHKYDAEKHCYFTSRNDEMLVLSKSRYPEIGICVGAGVDCVLTNDYLSVKNALAEKIKRA